MDSKKIGIAGIAFLLGVVLTGGIFAALRSHGSCGDNYATTKVAPK